MRSIILLTLSILLSSYTYSQFAPVGAMWYYSYYGDMGYKSYTCTKDSVSIEDEKIYQIIEGKVRLSVPYVSANTKDILYQENNKVYLVFKGSMYLLYDFGLEQDNEVTLYVKAPDLTDTDEDIMLPIQCKINEISTVMIDGQSCKRFSASILNYEDYQDDYVSPSSVFYTEKIGSNTGFIPSIGLPQPATDDQQLRCYYDESTEYVTPYWKNYYPNQSVKPCDFINPQYTDIANTRKDKEKSFYLSEKQLYIQDLQSAIIGIYNTSGVLCHSKKLQQQNEIIDLSGLSSGIYIVVVYNNDRMIFIQKIRL